MLAEIMREMISQPEIPEERTEVSLMSLHKAKGLEAEVVIIAGCVEGLLPYVDGDADPSEQELMLEEARRLFYVGITRSANTLILSYPYYMQAGTAKSLRVEYTGDTVAKLVPSRFLTELGPECPSTLTGDELTKKIKKE